MNAADVDFVVTHPEGYELDPKFVGDARVEYDQLKAFRRGRLYLRQELELSGVTVRRTTERC